MGMRGMTGLEACERLRELLKNPPPPEIEVMNLISTIESELRLSEVDVEDQVEHERGLRCHAQDEVARLRKILNDYGRLTESMRDALNP